MKRKKVRRPPPASRSDAAQRSGAKSKKVQRPTGPQGLPGTQTPTTTRQTRTGPQGLPGSQGEHKATPIKKRVRRVRNQQTRKHLGLNADRATGVKRDTPSVRRSISEARLRVIDKRLGKLGEQGKSGSILELGKKALPGGDRYLATRGPLTGRRGGIRVMAAAPGINPPKPVARVLRNATRDAIDLPANTVSSTFLVGKELATGHPVKAGKMLVDPVVEIAKHPVKSFTEHPLNTGLIVTGGLRGADRAVGKAARSKVAPAKARKAASTERPGRRVEGTAAEVPRSYSKGPAGKAMQKGIERAGRARRVKHGKPAERFASPRETKRLVTEDFAAEQARGRASEGKTATKARKALPRKPTAAESLAAQGITDLSKADLAAYLKEIKAAAKTKSVRSDPVKVKKNRTTQKLIEKALKDFDPVKVEKAARAYSKLAAELEPQVLARKLVEPAVAEATRLSGVRVRRTSRGSNPETAAPKRKAAAALRDANTKVIIADAEFAKATAELAAAKRKGPTGQRGNAPAAEATLKTATVARDAAHAALEVARTEAARTAAAHSRAHMPPGAIEPAYVSHQAIPPRVSAIQRRVPEVPIKIKRTATAIREGTIDAHPAKLVEQATHTQRLINAADARGRFIDRYGYRSKKSDPVQSFATRKEANALRKTAPGGAEGWGVLRKQDGEFALVKKDALDRLSEHESPTRLDLPVARAATTQWRRNVLAWNPRWLAGQVVEGAVRDLIAGAGPTSYYGARRLLKETGGRAPVVIKGRTIRKGVVGRNPELAAELQARGLGGGQYGSAGRAVQDRHIRRQTEDLAGFAKALSKFRQAPGVHHLVDAVNAHSKFVFETVNGRIERQYQTAALGKVLRDDPLLADSVRLLTTKAVREAAEGKFNTNNMVAMARKIDDIYGRYDKFGPKTQAVIANYTPFLAWTMNATNFLYHVLPRDHPVFVALQASANTATEAWRKEHGLFLDFYGQVDGQLPPYLMNSVEGKDGSHLRLGKYLPVGLLNQEGGTPISGLGQLLLPQVSEIAHNLAGRDFTGAPLADREAGARGVIAAAASLFEGQIPASSQAAGVAGVKLPNQKDSAAPPEPTLIGRIRKTSDPFRYTPGRSSQSRSTPAESSWGDAAATADWGSGSSSSGGW